MFLKMFSYSYIHNIVIPISVVIISAESACSMVEWTGIKTPILNTDESEIASGLLIKDNKIECLLHCGSESSVSGCFYYDEGRCSCLNQFHRQECDSNPC